MNMHMYARYGGSDLLLSTSLLLVVCAALLPSLSVGPFLQCEMVSTSMVGCLDL